MSNAYTISGQQFIGGQRRASGEAELVSLRADNGQPTGHRFFSASHAETAAAADAAAQAFTAYSQLSAERRADFLEAIAEQLDALDEEFFNFAMQETALPLARLSGERARTSGQMRLFASLLRRGDVHGVRIDCALPQRTPLPRPDLRQYRTALGPVAVFGASNFPLAFSTAGGDTAAALAAGCPVVFKAHSGHMITAELTAQAIERAREQQQIPAGVFNMIYGNRIGAESGSASGHSGGRFYRLAARRQSLVRSGDAPSAADPGLCRDVEHQPAGHHATCLGQAWAANRTRSAGLFHVGLRPVLHQAGVDYWHTRRSLQPVYRELRQIGEAAAPQPMLNAGTLAHYRRGLAALDQQEGIRHLAGSREALPYLADTATVSGRLSAYCSAAIPCCRRKCLAR